MSNPKACHVLGPLQWPQQGCDAPPDLVLLPCPAVTAITVPTSKLNSVV